MKAIVIVLSALIVVGTSASISEPEGVVASAQKSWFEKAIDSIESTFKGMVTTIESGFIKSTEERKEKSPEGPDASFANRTQEIIEVFGQKFLKTRIVSQQVSNNSIKYIEREVMRPISVEEAQGFEKQHQQ